MKEFFEKWEPRQNLPTKIYLKEFKDDPNLGIIISFKEENDSLITFGFDWVLSYRNTNEGDLLKTFNECKGLTEWCFVKVMNSRYLNWFHEESYGIYKEKNIIHYRFLTDDDVIDVLSVEEPKIIRVEVQ